MKKISVIGIMIMLVVGLIACASTAPCRSRRLHRTVRNHYNDFGETYVTLGELTAFEWDRALFYYWTNPQFIYDRLGVWFSSPWEQIGILFVHEYEIVYYEHFPQIWEGAIDPRGTEFTILGARNGDIFYPDDVFLVISGDRIQWQQTTNE
ncbi:MAG: hypothetical protein FWC89_13765 [Defluviitaleaceae bacterium]|nr:hypothetical protein [Defluviitaleaceae bacterium]